MLRVTAANILGRKEEFGSVNLIVGPNNSGKSTLLRELHTLATTMTPATHPTQWVTSVSYEISNARDGLKRIYPNVFAGQSRGFSDAFDMGFRGYQPHVINSSNAVSVAELIRTADNNTVQLDSYEPEQHNTAAARLHMYLARTTVVLEETVTRISQQYSTNIGEPSARPADIMQHLFSNPSALSLLNRHINQAFNFELCFDNMPVGTKPLRIKPLRQIRNRRNLQETADRWEQSAPRVDTQGDGIKAFLKVVLSLIEPSNEIVSIDEPECFLHPSHRRELGRLVSVLAQKHNKQVFVATHDIEFISGLILNNQFDAKVLYVRKDENGHDYKSLTLREINEVTERDSVYVSNRLLQSFFFHKTILCEDEFDRILYERAALEFFGERTQDINFVGIAGGKGTITRVLKKFAPIGTRSGAIYDFDFLMSQDSPFESPLKNEHHNRFRQQYQRLLSRDVVDKRLLKAQGLEYLREANRDLCVLAEKAISWYAKRDIYVVPCGEIESFLGDSHMLNDAIEYIQSEQPESMVAFLKSVISQ